MSRMRVRSATAATAPLANNSIPNYREAAEIVRRASEREYGG